ncbi:MAG: DUF3168 domain-containing protein [Pseudomonadota bacterium]
MSDALTLWPFQQAIYAYLSEYEGLQMVLGAPVRLYDDPPPDAVFPYAVIGETRSSAYAGIEGGIDHDFRLHVFSRHAGRQEVKTILDALYTALHDAPVPLPGQCLLSLRFVFADIFRRTDRNLYQGVARFRGVTHPENPNVV